MGRAKVRHEGWVQGGTGTIAAQLVLRVTPGGRIDTAALARNEAVWDERRSFWMRADTSVVHDYTEEAPYWLLISTKPGAAFMASYKGVAKQSADVIEGFCLANGEKVAAARKS